MPDPVVQRTLLEIAASLPAPVLRAVSGVAAVRGDGATLDPRLQFLARNWRTRRPFSAETPEEAREVWAETVAVAAPRPSPDVKVERLETSDGVPLRVWRPEEQDPHVPALVWLHEGGGVVGSPETAAGLCARFAAVGRCAVIAPEYALAPERRFPAGFEDARSAWRWTRDAAPALESAAADPAVGGQDVGGGMAAALARELTRSGEGVPALQLLICPLLDVAGETASLRTRADAWPLSAEEVAWQLGQYMGADEDPADPRLSPFRAADLSGLPPAVVASAGFDPLRDQAELYARKLRRAGVPVAYRRYDSLTHAFPQFAGLAPAAEAACEEIAELLREGLEGRLGAAQGPGL